MNEISEDVEDSILYELLPYSEWSQEQDVITKTPEQPYWILNNVKSYFRKCAGAYYISNWVNQQLPWLFAVGANGRAVAILQDNALEVRTSRDSYSVPIGKTFVTKDPYPQWRKLEWSPDGTFVAVAHSNGTVDVYDLLASHLFSIPPKTKASVITATSNSTPENAMVGLAFVDTRTKNAHWSYELLCLDHYGELRAFFVSPTQGYLESHCFSFASKLPYGITSFCVDQSRNLLVVATPSISSTESSSSTTNQETIGSKCGLTSWRFLDEQPYYIRIQSDTGLSSNRWFQSFQKKDYGDTVVRLSPSMDDCSLAAIHLSGAVSTWSLPALKCQHFWPIDRQPGFDELNPSLLLLPAHRRVNSPAFQNPFKFHPIDVNWWSPDSLILARCSGAVSVCAAANLRNKLGSSAEFFEGPPRISPAFDSTFLGLECEVKVQRKRLQPTTDDPTGSGPSFADDEHHDDEELSEDDEKKNMSQRVLRSLLYWATDSEKFRPPRKRPKLLAKTYRLLAFKRTTPEELYICKLDAEEYGEALALARAYGLDCDLVYQRQWRNATATIATIQDYLSKVTKRNWVLRECLERVPTNVDAARELLLYGLKNTDLAAVADVEGDGRDKTVFAAIDYLETEAEIARREEEQRRHLLAKIDFDNLTVQQKMLISTRRRLLQYLDRLSIYEMILGGPHAAGQRFDPSFFETFRAQSSLESAAGFARQGEVDAVADMFTFNGPQTLPHRLAICSCFPETMLPTKYSSVLPECDVDGEVFLWEQKQLRQPDWCESSASLIALDAERILEMEAVELFYNDEPHLRTFRSAGVELTSDLVSLWYRTRGSDIEKQSMLVDNALDLIKLGLERNVPHLEQIHHQLLTLETLVYDLHHDQLSLEKLNKMSELSVCQMIMSDCDSESFLAKLNHWLMPYLRRVEAMQSGRTMELLRGLLVVRSQENLDWALEVCANSKTDKVSPVVSDSCFLISLALDCIYACQRPDQLEDAMKIYDCLPERPTGSEIDPALARLHDQLDQLQSHLEAADILGNHEVAVTPSTVAAKQNDEEQLEQLFVRLTRTAMRNNQPSTDNPWKDLLDDMLDLQSKVFHRISPQLCYEILVGSLLSSAKKESITAAGSMLRLDPHLDSKTSRGSAQSENGHRKPLEMSVIPYERSKQLILQAAEEYFNSSENLSDPGLELASYCLNLVTIEDEEIQREKDLISAVQLIYDYGLDMPPLKIRLSKNRLLLIDQVLKQANKAYKNSSRLLRLGHLLRASDESCSTAVPPSGDVDRRKQLEGEIYSRIAETALSKQDLDVAGQMCSKLRLGNHPIGWKVCSRVAELNEVTDLALKLDLVSYALVYCPTEIVEELLQLRWTLERKQLADGCVRQIDMYINYEGGRETFLDLLNESSVEIYRQGVARKLQSQPTNRTGGGSGAGIMSVAGNMPQQVFQATSDTTMQLVNVVKSTLNVLNDGRKTDKVAKMSPNNTLASTDNKECNRWGLPVFYWDCWRDGRLDLHESQLDASYRLYSLPEMANRELDLLSSSWRLMILDSLKEFEGGNASGRCLRRRLRDDVLAKLAETLFPQDCLLALGHLLDLERVGSAWEPLTRLPSTEITLQSAAYYFALRMMRFSADSLPCGPASIRPRNLIERCFSSAVNNPSGATSEEDRDCADLLKRSLRLLADVSEAQQLRRLDGGVDINRFTSDDSYKRDTIVGLAITTDPAIYSAAVRLAAHYGVSAWEVTFSHLTALFAEETIEPSQITKHMEEQRMRQILFADVDSLGRKMVDVIYPSISGRDYARLALFFELINSDASMAGLTDPPASVFIRIVRKAGSVKGLDVKRLTRSADEFIREVEKVVNAENVAKLAKLSQLISSTVKRLSADVSQATVHSIWTRKYFFQLADDGKNAEAADWLARFDSCQSHANKLDAVEFCSLVDQLCFSDRSLDVLTLEIRTQLCRRCLAVAQQRQTKAGKNEDVVASWEACRTRLNKWLEHLERLNSERYAEVRTEIYSTSGGQLWREFDRSRAEGSALRRLLLRVLMDGQPVSTVRHFVSIFPSDFDSTPEEVVVDCVRLTLDFLGRQKNAPTMIDGDDEDDKFQLLSGRDAFQVLLHLLSQVGDGAVEDGDGIGEMLRQFYEDDKIDVEIRLRMMLMLQTLPADFVGLSESGTQVQWLRTLALIQQSWSEERDGDGQAGGRNLVGHLREEDLRSAEGRRTLFDRLLEMSHTIGQLASLAKLLHFWPPFDSESDPHSTPWTVLWTAMTKMTDESFPTDASVLDSVKLAMEQKPALSEECIRIIYQTVSGRLPSAEEDVGGHITRLRLHIALRSSLPSLLEDVIRFVDTAQELNESHYDQEILELIVERGLVGRLAGSALYGPLCEHLLSSTQATSRMEDVARQLVDHGHRSKAGHLLLLTSGMPRYLLNLSTSLYFARKKL